MKKKLVLALAALLSVSALNVSAYSDVDNSPYKDSINALKDYKIMSGDGDLFEPTKYLSRAEAAKILSELEYAYQGISDTEDDAPEGNNIILIVDENKVLREYSDVPSDHWAHKYISDVTNRFELMNGFDDGNFHPDEEITYSQLLKLMVNITGYTEYAEEAGGYPTGFCAIAKTLNITGGLDKFALSAPVTREAAAHIIYNTVNIPLCIIDAFDFSTDDRPTLYKINDGTNNTSKITLISQIGV